MSNQNQFRVTWQELHDKNSIPDYVKQEQHLGLCCEIELPTIPSKKEERNMSQVQINPSLLPDLKALAGAGVQDEFSDLQGIPQELKEALDAQVATEKREKYSRMAKTLLEILRASDEKKKALVEELRNVRALERQLLAKIGDLQEATDAAKETSNYLPLILMLDPSLRPFVSEAELATAKAFVAPKNAPAAKRVHKSAK